MRSGMFGWVVAATVVHVGAIFSLARPAAAEAPSPAPTEIDIAPLVEPPPSEDPTETESAPVAARAPAVVPKTIAPRPVAKAPALIVANDQAAISFPDDPDSDEPGAGIVGNNGTAKTATAPPATSATTPPKPVTPPPSPPPPAIVSLSRTPSLPDANACKGFFPAAADDDEAVVSLEVSVRASGEVAAATVVAETPKGQGFGAAARSCLLARRFVPALDAEGHATPAATAIRVHFTR